ncbi:type II secretion system minor pseudopilin GspK [Budviciaceae bacterium BWR-B9]|uniref:Type II secretion system protein K n=1 Tax=Limnobaculum allomyrinae TaxID=2791986 RepID=A0ABS1IU24_9GAMM|nr:MULTISPECIES: type II secretion system minor pseudopilin GspK [Limnobaculum]MBK5145239.1 type II secretion system minor pseudopilin GspK [Limnobaculum allomyrinae]MBV7693071.1 type II secretion system minor pseudopilin GspK [Limnobaculum sp. M2-1]
MNRGSKGRQRGVALLVVLILLVLMSVLAARISQQFTRNLQKIQFQLGQQTLRWNSDAAVQLAIIRLGDDLADGKKPSSLDQSWAQPVNVKTEDYQLDSQVFDAQTCFNVNSLLTPDNSATSSLPGEKAMTQKVVEYLMTSAGINSATAETLFNELTVYLGIDSGTDNSKASSAMEAFKTQQPPRVPAKQMMYSISELKLLPGFPLESYARLSKLLCALPNTKTKVNINSLTEQQAPLLSGLFLGELTVDDASQLISKRPESGWETVEAFQAQLEKQFPVKAKETAADSYMTVNSNFFTVYTTGRTDNLTLRFVDNLYLDEETREASRWLHRYRTIE